MVDAECLYWGDAARSLSGAASARADAFHRALEPLRAPFVALSGGAHGALGGALDLVCEGALEDALDALWRGPADLGALRSADAFPVARMRPLLGAVGGAFAGYVRAAARGWDVWGGGGGGEGPPSPRAWLEDARRLLSEWCTLLRRLCVEVWVESGERARPWAGEPPPDGGAGALCARLGEVLELRAVRAQIGALLGEAAVGAQLAAAFAPLRRVDALDVGADHGGAWAAALAPAGAALAPLEAAAGDALARVLEGAGPGPGAQLAALRAYGALRRRAAAAACSGLATAVATALARASAHLADIDSAGAALGGRSGGGGGGRGEEKAAEGNVSALAAAVEAAHGLRARVASLRALAGELGGGAGEKLAADCADAGAALERRSRELLREWCGWAEGVAGAAAGGGGAAHASASLLTFDTAGNITLRYAEPLVLLQRDAALLEGLGLRLPERVAAGVAAAGGMAATASALAHVAGYYNALGGEIIPATKGLLLEPLLALESVVKAGGARGGGGGSDAEALLGELRARAEGVAAANRALRRAHGAIGDHVAALAGVDLLRARDVARSRWGALRDAARAATRGHAPDAARPWLLHWDAQVAKVLDAGYRAGLEVLLECLPPLRVELSVPPPPPPPPPPPAAGAADDAALLPPSLPAPLLCFSPPLEEVRAAFYGALRAYSAFPESLGTLSGSSAAGARLAALPARGAHLLGRLYYEGEVALAKAARVRDGFSKWALLARAAARGGGEAFFTRVAGITGGGAYERAWAALRAKGEELGKIPDLCVLDFLVLSVAPLKAAAARALGALGEALAACARRDAVAALEVVEAAAAGAGALLGGPPATSRDAVAAAQRAWRAVEAQRPSVGGAAAAAGALLAALASPSAAGAGAVDVEGLAARLRAAEGAWAAASPGLDAFGEVLEAQREALKGRLAGDVAELAARVERAASRWGTLRPVDDERIRGWEGPHLESLTAALGEWEATVAGLRAGAAALVDAADGYGLPHPQQPALEALAADVGAVCASWARWREYTGERAAYAEVDWLSFRPRLFELLDWAARWGDAAAGGARRAREGGPPDPTAARIGEETDALRRAFPALKLAKGEAFRDEHWGALFKRVGVPRGVTLESLRVAHFLEPPALAALAGAVPFLKELCGRAAGEVAIRAGLSEVKAWCDSAEWALREHASPVPGRPPVALIREFKEVLVALGDTQALLGSLKDSPFFKPFAEAAAAYEDAFGRVDQAAQALAAIQRRWVYLEPVFARGALPSEAGRFRRVDEEFRSIMGRLAGDPRVMALADAAAFPGLLPALAAMGEQLERCQRALAALLEEKRSRSPRFYFLGDDDLLELLGQARSLPVIQAHLKKLFAGVARVGVAPGDGALIALLSAAGEDVPLRAPVPLTDDVCAWLGALCDGMTTALSAATAACGAEAGAGSDEVGGGAGGWVERIPRFQSLALSL
jgi:dynein heavy chain 2